MRAETRHQLKEDRFSKATFEAAEATVHWSQEHQSKLIVGTIGLVVIVAIVFGGWYYIDQQDEKASLEMSDAVRTMEAQLRPPGTPGTTGFPKLRVVDGTRHGCAQTVPGDCGQISADQIRQDGALLCRRDLGATGRLYNRRK